MVFSSVATFLGDLLYVLLFGAVNRLFSDLFFEVLFISGFLFLLYRRIDVYKRQAFDITLGICHGDDCA